MGLSSSTSKSRTVRSVSYTHLFYCQKGFNPRYYVVSDDQSQIPYLYYNNGSEIGEIEILVSRELKVLPEVSEIVGAITNSTKNKIDHKIFYPEL